MAGSPFSTKRIQINKATTTMVTVIAGAAFVTVSSLMFCRALLSQRSYQSRVISAQEKARDQLKANIDSVSSLKTQYKAFVDQTQNVLGGNPSGTGDRDGDNARIILDALPSKYDFPALATSLEKILQDGRFSVDAISGSDDEVAQSQNNSSQPVEMPFTLAITGSYPSVQSFVATLEKSIRPIKINTLGLSGEDADLKITVEALTYYQPAKTLNISTQEVK